MEVRSAVPAKRTADVGVGSWAVVVLYAAGVGPAAMGVDLDTGAERHGRVRDAVNVA